MSFIRRVSWGAAAWPVAVFALALNTWPRAQADGVAENPRFVTFCCQGKSALPPEDDGMSWGRVLRFGTCFEASDTRFGRQCRSESMFYYPVAVRTDRTFSFDNVTRELTLYDR